MAGLTIRSSRRRFAGRLNSGVRPHMNKYAAILILLLPAQSFAEGKCMDTAIGDTEIEECASQDLSRADSALDLTYKATLATLDKMTSDGDKGAAEAKEQLIAAQRKWDDFRKSDCDVVFYLNVEGSIRIPETMKCMANHADHRRQQLQHLFD